MRLRAHFVAIMALLVLMLIASTVWGQVATGFVTNPPNTVTATINGCRNTGQVPLYIAGPDSSYASTLICADGVYTGGDLGKGWNELDLVPYRLTLKNGNSGGPVVYDIIVAADY
jgi:hypothetical protein